jgi:peptide-methionine (S)-S-oxide reductase
MSSISGYTGGHTVNPTYQQVCSETTGHAEVVQVEYNPAIIDTEKLLQIFFFLHDPTQLNRQGNDVGTQYRSAVFYHDLEQKNIAEKMISELNQSGKYNSKIVTEVTKLDKFYPAEEYHQNYFLNNPNQGYCNAVVRPKVDKFLKTYKEFINN